MDRNLFAAITFDENVRAELTSYDEAVWEIAPRTRTVRPENRHVTLVFLGQDPRLREAAAVLDSLDMPAFHFLIGGFGTFGRGRSKTLWIGVEVTPGLLECHQRLRRGFQEEGFNVPDRAFKPHITLSYKWDYRSAPDLGVLRSRVTPLAVSVSAVHLLRTANEDGHTYYENLFTKELRA